MRKNNNKIVISWGDSTEIGKQIASNIDCKFVKPEFKIFSNFETGAWIKEDLSEASKIIIVRSLVKPVNDSWIELLFVLDIIKRNSKAKVTAILPWFSYAPQDKIFRRGESLSSEVMINLINATQISKTIVLDIHSEALLEKFKHKVINIIPYELLAKHLMGQIDESCICVALDKGGKSRAKNFAKLLGIPFTALDKTRDRYTGKVAYTASDFDFKGKTTIAFDDYTGSGSTLIESSKMLKELGARKCIYCLTHIFDNKVARKISRSKLDLLITTNASVSKKKIRSKKIQIVDIIEEISKVI